MASQKSLISDHRYRDFIARYAFDPVRFSIEVCNLTPTYQQRELLDSVSKPGSRTSVSSGHGCFGLGTLMMSASGEAVPVERIAVGDALMGPDGASVRTVLELKRGREALYRFTYMDGTSHVFNESHILCLVATNSKGLRVAGVCTTVTVREWLKWGEDKKRCHAIYRSGVEDYARQQADLSIPPYVLGAWLGDGHSDGHRFTTADAEIKAAFDDYAASIGYSVVMHRNNSGRAEVYSIKRPGNPGRGRKNLFSDTLRSLGVLGDKHIPDAYLYASRADRLELLAGLLDTDGHQDKGSHGFEITQKGERLAKQIVTLARSLGCHATVKEVTKTCHNNGVVGQYWRVTIGRNIDQIPVRLPHKKIAPGERQRGKLHFGIRSCEPLGEGDYYGFVLDGDSRFLGADFTVLHNTGKTSIFAVIALWHLLCYYFSNTILSAPKLATVQDGVWKEFADLSEKIKSGKQAWIWDYFAIETEKVYVKGHKLNWWVTAKSAPKGSPENLAGAHRDWLLWLIDEASGVPDANFGVITGSLTDRRNRIALASQPTRASGFFYDTHHKLSRDEGGVWNNLVFSSVLSPIVSLDFIAEKKEQYTSEEFFIKVLGVFPENSSKYLLGPAAIERCVGRNVIRPDEAWGWMLAADIGGGGWRDESAILAFKVAGQGEHGPDARRVQLVQVPLLSNTQDPSQIHGRIVDEAAERVNSTAMIDAGGMGLIVCKQLENDGFSNFVKVNWGSPNWQKDYKSRYVNQRAQAVCGLSRAVETGRFGIDEGIDKAIIKKIVNQGSRIPYFYNEKAQRLIMKKEDMKKEGITSPDVWDACSFPFLESAVYSASGEGYAIVGDDTRESRERIQDELMAAAEAAAALAD